MLGELELLGPAEVSPLDWFLNLGSTALSFGSTALGLGS